MVTWVWVHLRGTVAWIAGFLVVSATVFAGGGPENILIVVNAQSESSKTIANHYIQLRDVPASHILYIDWKGGIEACKGEKFRQRLLQPILQAIDERKLGLQIDYVVYSSDFPWRIEFQDEFAERKISPTMRPIASLTGSTYLWPYIQLKNEIFYKICLLYL